MDDNNKNSTQGELVSLAKKIRTARKDANLSQKTLAHAIGVSDKSVSAYEKGRSVPPFEKLKRIAHQTNRPLTFFTEESSDETTILSKLKMIEHELEAIKKLLNKPQ